jgi:hypothetical protein
MLEIFVKKNKYTKEEIRKVNIPKRKSEADHCRKTDNPMAKKKDKSTDNDLQNTT